MKDNNLKFEAVLTEQIMLISLRLGVIEKLLIENKVIKQEDYIALLKSSSDEFIKDYGQKSVVETKKENSNPETEIK